MTNSPIRTRVNRDLLRVKDFFHESNQFGCAD